MQRAVTVCLLISFGVSIAGCVGVKDITLVKINDSIYMAETASNVYLVTTPPGNVVIDTASAPQPQTATQIRAAVGFGSSAFMSALDQKK